LIIYYERTDAHGGDSSHPLLVCRKQGNVLIDWILMCGRRTREYQLDQSSSLPASAVADPVLDPEKRPATLTCHYISTSGFPVTCPERQVDVSILSDALGIHSQKWKPGVERTT
jgi:hypothetical protein